MLFALALAAVAFPQDAPPAQEAPRLRNCTPRSTPMAWVTNDDYPAPAMRARQQGVVEFTLDVDADGCATACRIDRSSGYPILDNTTCSLLVRRARFRPAEDDKGRPIPATWSSQFKWVLPPVLPIAPEPWRAHAVVRYSEDGSLVSCRDSGNVPETHLGRFCDFATRIPPRQLAFLRKGRSGPFTVLMEGAARFDGQPAFPVVHPGEVVAKVTITFGIDAGGDIVTCNARDETPPALAGKFSRSCETMSESYVPTLDAAGKPVPRQGSIAIVHTMVEEK